jgi:hypothetical protein
MFGKRTGNIMMIGYPVLCTALYLFRLDPHKMFS